MTTIAEEARDDYVAASYRLEDKARAHLADGEMPQAREAMLGALIAYAAGRGELKDIEPGEAICHLCGGIRACDIAAHEARREVWHLA